MIMKQHACNTETISFQKYLENGSTMLTKPNLMKSHNNLKHLGYFYMQKYVIFQENK